ncbi:hypothetical protein DFJ43DRAFT_1043457 [Lentinula guzmanii]|uniref:Protein YOP1 n=1 Tax=Lentinula guzmanii TaxID=2804957 RepID=A0AA38JE82_9AGAR|nr:hypothetical protein DFJ43DRAFT_1043457 [Lentinula guzmanii]
MFVPILRMFMLFLNVWDTFKTLKPPPYKIRNGKAEPPSVRSITQRKRDLKGCLAVWIVWCCFTVYERHVEPIVSLFIPFYNEFKSLVILFLIFTRARGAEPIFLHLLRPMLRPYTKSIDSSLELFRLIGDLLFVIISFPLRPVAAFIPSFFRPGSHEDEIPPPYSEAAAPDQQHVSPSSTFQQSNGYISSFHPADPAADMEWRQYPNLPSAYPPTPLVTLSRLPAQGHVGHDPGAAAGPHTIWIPPVAEEDEEDDRGVSEDRQDFRRSLSPPRRPSHPGFGNHDGLSDESDRGAKNHHEIKELPNIQRNEGASSESSSAEEAEEMEMDDEGSCQYNSDGDAGDSDEDSFNITLQTPRVPLSLQPSSATTSRSTIRLRASARSVFADLERETEGKRHASGSVLLPPIDTSSNSGQGSSPSSIDPESLSISSGDDSVSLSLSNPQSAAGHEKSHLIPLSGTENDGIMSDSSLGSAPDAGPATTMLRFISPTGRGRKRSHSRSFPPEHPKRKSRSSTTSKAGSAVLQRLSSVDSASSSSSSRAHSPSNDSHPNEADADTTVKAIPEIVTVDQTHLVSSADPLMKASDVESSTLTGEGADEAQAVEASIGGPRKRRKVISTTSGQGRPSSSESEHAITRSHTGSRLKLLHASSSDKRKTTVPSTRIRRQLSGATASASEGADDSSASTVEVGSKAASTAKGKGRGTAPKAASVPTRRRFDVSHKPMGVPISNTRTTRATTKPALTDDTSIDISDKHSDAPEAGSGTDHHPLRLARKRAKAKERV